MAAFNFPATNGVAGDGSFKYTPTGTELEYSWYSPPGVWRLTSGSGGGATIEVSPTPPSPANQGDLWFNSDDGRLYVYYVQGNGQEQWVDAAPAQGFDGGPINSSITTPERTITDSDFDLSTGPYWRGTEGVNVPNPTNAVAGLAGIIKLEGAPASWGSNFSTAPVTDVFPCIVPFYVDAPTSIRLGKAVEVA